MTLKPLALIVSLIGTSRVRRVFSDAAVRQNTMKDISTAQETQHKTQPTTG